MRISIVFFILSTLLSYNVLHSQIDASDLKETHHPNDSSAHAAYKLHKAWVSFDVGSRGIQLITRYEEIIKVYDDQGEDYANFEVYLYRDGGDRQTLNEIKGATYNIVNGKKVKTKLDKKDIYTDEVSEDLHIKKWAMPNVRAGSIIEISYTKRSPWIYTIPRFDFQKEVPIDEVEYQVQIPEPFTYTPIASGLIHVDREEKTRNGSTGLENVFIFSAQDIPALMDDDYVLDIDDYRASMKYEIYQVNFPNEPLKNYSKSWGDIAKNLQEHTSFGKEISKRIPDLKEFVASLNGASDEEKIKGVYSMIQNSYAWNKEYGLYANNGVRNLVKNGSGNVGDINLLMLNLLNQLDIDARPLLIKSRWNGILNPYFPSISEFNYVVAYIPMGDDSFLLLDASSKKMPMGQLPTRAVNLHGLLITGDTGDAGEIIPLHNPNHYSYTALNQYEIDLETPAIVGGGKSLRKGYAATKYRLELDAEEEEDEDEKDQDEEEDDEEEEEEEIQIENEVEVLEIKGVDDIYDNITVSFDEKLYNELDVIGDQVFLDAALDFGIRKNPFFEEDRTMPIFYNTLQTNKHITSIKLPEGYKIESMPESINMTLEDGSIAFRYEVKEIAGSIKINYTFLVKKDVVAPEFYPGLREIYSRIIAITKQKIVLSKV